MPGDGSHRPASWVVLGTASAAVPVRAERRSGATSPGTTSDLRPSGRALRSTGSVHSVPERVLILRTTPIRVTRVHDPVSVGILIADFVAGSGRTVTDGARTTAEPASCDRDGPRGDKRHECEAHDPIPGPGDSNHLPHRMAGWSPRRLKEVGR